MISKIISFNSIPKLESPYLIAAWPGMGKVALTAVTYLREQLGATYFGQIDESDFFAPTGAMVEKQIISAPPSPTNKFYYFKSAKIKHDLIIFLGSEQPLPHREYAFAKELLKTAKMLGVIKVFTTAAAPSDMHYKDTPRVFAVPNHQDMLQELLQYKVQFMGDGTIAGLNGLMVSIAREMEIEGVCLLGEIPFFTVQVEFPRASQMILGVLTEMLGVTIDMVDLELYADEKMKEIEPLAKLLTKEKETRQEDADEEPEIPRSGDTDVPEEIRLRIEKLFQKAEFDRTYKSKMKLKEELDHWNVFDDYQDRFLDLFKKNKGES
ncbi:PAC2 family protein [bacterium]|nr:PAC2 family protein [bacterium]